MARERFHRHALQRRAEARFHLRRFHVRALTSQLRQQLPRVMRRDAFARIERTTLQRTRGEQIERIAVRRLRLAHVLEHATGPLRHLRRFGVGRTDQCGGNGGLALVEAMRRLVEQRARQRIDAHQFAAKRHDIEIGLQNLVLAPAPVEHLRGHRLADLLHHRAPARPLPPVAIEQPGKLHGDGARPARALVPEIAPGRSGHRTPVHAAVFKEALVLAHHQRRAQRGRHIGQRRPLATSHRGVGTDALNRLTLARQDQRLGRAEVLLHLFIARQRACERTEEERAHSQQRGQRCTRTHHTMRCKRNGCKPEIHKGWEAREWEDIIMGQESSCERCREIIQHGHCNHFPPSIPSAAEGTGYGGWIGEIEQPRIRSAPQMCDARSRYPCPACRIETGALHHHRTASMPFP